MDRFQLERVSTARLRVGSARRKSSQRPRSAARISARCADRALERSPYWIQNGRRVTQCRAARPRARQRKTPRRVANLGLLPILRPKEGGGPQRAAGRGRLVPHAQVRRRRLEGLVVGAAAARRARGRRRARSSGDRRRAAAQGGRRGRRRRGDRGRGLRRLRGAAAAGKSSKRPRAPGRDQRVRALGVGRRALPRRRRPGRGARGLRELGRAVGAAARGRAARGAAPRRRRERRPRGILPGRRRGPAPKSHSFSTERRWHDRSIRTQARASARAASSPGAFWTASRAAAAGTSGSRSAPICGWTRSGTSRRCRATFPSSTAAAASTRYKRRPLAGRRSRTRSSSRPTRRWSRPPRRRSSRASTNWSRGAAAPASTAASSSTRRTVAKLCFEIALHFSSPVVVA